MIVLQKTFIENDRGISIKRVHAVPHMMGKMKDPRSSTNRSKEGTRFGIDNRKDVGEKDYHFCGVLSPDASVALSQRPRPDPSACQK